MKQSPLVPATFAAIAAGFFVFGFYAAGPVSAAQSASQHSHAGHAMTEAPVPREPGQSSFAAIAEIVALLEADPETDWSKVDIAALREHLVDMNNLVLGARATATRGENEIVYEIKGDGEALRAIQAMVPAHAQELDASGPWAVSAETTPDGARLVVGADSAADLEKADALGFFGLMAYGAHHQPHHLAMATGRMRH